MFLSGLLIGVSNLAMQVFFARYLGLAIIADYATITVAVSLISAATTMGLNQAVIGRGFTVRRFENCLTLTLWQFVLTLLIFAVLAGVLALSRPDVLARLWGPGLLQIIGITALIPANTFNCEIETRLEYDRLALMRVSAFLAANVAAAMLSLMHFGLYAIASRDFFNGGLYLLLSFLSLRRPLRLRFDRPIAGALGRFSGNVWFNYVSSEGVKRLDFALAGLVLSPTLFAIYFQSRNLFEGSLSFILYPIQSTVFSYLRRHRAETDFFQVARKLFLLMLGGWVVGTVILYFFGTQLLTLLLGAKWARGGALMIPMETYVAIAVFFEILVSMSKALNRMRPVLIGRAVNAAMIAVLVPLLGYHYSLVGAGWATAGASGAMLLLVLLLFRRTGLSHLPRQTGVVS